LVPPLPAASLTPNGRNSATLLTTVPQKINPNGTAGEEISERPAGTSALHGRARHA
jgi:hypothetical protein